MELFGICMDNNLFAFWSTVYGVLFGMVCCLWCSLSFVLWCTMSVVSSAVSGIFYRMYHDLICLYFRLLSVALYTVCTMV